MISCSQAKRIRIDAFLAKIGIVPERQLGSGIWYHSPLHTADHNPSFQVSLDGRAFHDWSSDKSGSIIDLALVLISSTQVSDALMFISKTMGIVSDRVPDNIEGQRPRLFIGREPHIRVNSVTEIQDIRLFGYAYSRGIRRDVLSKHCLQVNYVNAGHAYDSIGFANISGGYELRSHGFKAAVAPKDISLVGDLAGCPYMVFEGFFDFLSAVALEWYEPMKMNALVLNSTSLVDKSLSYLQNASEIYLFLDNDDAGMKASAKIQSVYPRAIDKSFLFYPQNDLNDRLLLMKNF